MDTSLRPTAEAGSDGVRRGKSRLYIVLSGFKPTHRIVKQRYGQHIYNFNDKPRTTASTATCTHLSIFNLKGLAQKRLIPCEILTTQQNALISVCGV